MMKVYFFLLNFCNLTYRPLNCLSDYLYSFSSIIFSFCEYSSSHTINFWFQHKIIFFVLLFIMSEFHFPTCKVSIFFVNRCSKITKILGFLSIPVVIRIIKQRLLSFTFKQFLIGIFLKSRSEMLVLVVGLDCILLSLKQLFLLRRCVWLIDII